MSKSFFVLALCWPLFFWSQVEIGREVRSLQVDSSLQGFKKGGLINLTLSQLSLFNWSAGGENSVGGNILAHFFINYGKKRSYIENSLDLGYGLLKQGKSTLKKTDDKIDFSSKYGFLFKKNFFFTTLFNFKTQFTNGYNYPNDSVKISTFLSPGYILLAMGLDYKWQDGFSLFAAPLTGKWTIVKDQTLADQGAFGVERAVLDSAGIVVTHGKHVRSEVGAYVKTFYQKKIGENLSLLSKLELFSNYFHNPQNIDVYWENLVGFKLSKILTLSINTVLIYDDDVMISVYDKHGNFLGKGPRTQFKELVGIGFSFKL